MILFEAQFNDTNLWHHKCRKYPIGDTPSDTPVGNVFVPGEFDHLAFVHGLPVAHDPSNTIGYAQPEGHHESIAQYPDRVYEGFAAWMAFGFYKIIDLALVKKISIPSDGTITITTQCHAWSSRYNDAHVSDGVGNAAFDKPEGTPGLTDDQRNITFRVGVGTDFLVATYGEGRHIYNKYAAVSGSFKVKAGETNIYIRANALWPLQHNNVYFDNVVVTFEPDVPPVTPPATECKGTPREQYERTVLLLHPTADDEWIRAILNSGAWQHRRITIGGSADDAGIGDLVNKQVLAVRPEDWNGDLAAFYAQYYPGTHYVPIHVDTPAQLTTWLENWLGGENPTTPPNGGSQSHLAPGLHLSTGDSGASDWYKTLKQNLDPNNVAPSVKVYGTPTTLATLKLFKDIDPRILTVGRLSQGLNGEPVEGVDMTRDPLSEAQRVMNASMPAWSQHRDYVDVWEVINEQDPIGVEGHTRLATFFKHCMDIANTNNYKIALFSYSVGVPEWNEIVAIANTGCLTQAKRDGHYIALHEYANPLDLHFGDSIPGAPIAENRGPLAFRYRYWQDAVGGAANMPNVLITEMNVDRDLRQMNAAEWDRQIRWYLNEVQHDEYVKAIHLFGWGSLGGAWASFDIQLAGFAPLWYQIVLDHQNDVDPPAPPDPPPTPSPSPKLFSQRDSQWGAMKMLPSSLTLSQAGCLLTGFASLFSIYDPDIDPAKLCQWVIDNNGFLSTGQLLIPKPFMKPGIPLDFVAYHTWTSSLANLTTLRRCLAVGPTLIGVDFNPSTPAYDQHFVLALREINNDLEIIDPWTGTKRMLLSAYGATNWSLERAIYAAIEYKKSTTDPPPPSSKTLVGFNDHPAPSGTAADFLRTNAVKGLIVRPLFIGGSGTSLDFSKEAAAGIRVIVNLRYSWSTDLGGSGTIPKLDTAEWETFIAACATIINTSTGVWGYELFNEQNNSREWPQPNVPLTPEAVARTYNRIRAAVTPSRRNMAIGALDPFNADGGDPREYLTRLYNTIEGAEFITAHGYIRGPHPDLVNSTAMFTDAPLTWQYLNYHRCVDALLAALPQPYKSKPIYITETNHIWKTNESVGDIGWVSDSRATDIVSALYSVAQSRDYAGIALYRWSGDQWQLYDNAAVLNAVKRIATS